MPNMPDDTMTGPSVRQPLDRKALQGLEPYEQSADTQRTLIHRHGRPGNTDDASPFVVLHALAYCAMHWSARAKLCGVPGGDIMEAFCEIDVYADEFPERPLSDETTQTLEALAAHANRMDGNIRCVGEVRACDIARAAEIYVDIQALEHSSPSPPGP